MNKALIDHYRCADNVIAFELNGKLSEDEGFFRFGHAICYGQSSSGYRALTANEPLYDVLKDVSRGEKGTPALPFHPTAVMDNLRFERYATRYKLSSLRPWKRALRGAYYSVRPILHVNIRKHVQRAHANGWQNRSFPAWPVDTTVDDLCQQLLLTSMKAKAIDSVPFIWFWPEGAPSCAVMTHDIEGERGKVFCTELMDIDDEFGIKSSIQVVPEDRYEVSDAFLDNIRGRGFEVNVQDLNHDGHLFYDQEEFSRRVEKINRYARQYHARGFRAAVLYRNFDWYDALKFSYDMSVPNVAHLDPQRGGCCTVLPYFVGNILEIPVTTTQDYMLFHLLKDYSLDLWKAQVNKILQKSGVISFIVHPDYIVEKRARQIYRDLLTFLREICKAHNIWIALPGEVDNWWRQRSQMRLVKDGDHWKITGEGCEKARVALARVLGDELKYEISPTGFSASRSC